MSRQLNFNHLYYFWVVAKEGNLTRAAKRLLIAQSALSSQIKQLEYQVGMPLFKKVGRKLELTEAGNIALSYAEKVFTLTDEMQNVFRHHAHLGKSILKIGVSAALSRNFVENFIRPLLGRKDVEIQLDSGSTHELQTGLITHKLDLVLSNYLPEIQQRYLFRIRQIAAQPLSIVGKPLPAGQQFVLETDLQQYPLLLPGKSTEVRARFDQICDTLQLTYQILAEINDMPALRLLARDANGIALLPAVVVQDELRQGILQEYCKIPGLYEQFYAISVKKQFEHDIVSFLLSQHAEVNDLDSGF